MVVHGIDAKNIRSVAVSNNLTRLILTTHKNNEYAIYYYKEDGKMFANWKNGFITGEEKDKILSIMTDKRYTK
jgi:hypothetical protein